MRYLWLWQASRCLQRWWRTRKGQTLSWQRWTAGLNFDTCVPAQRYVDPLRDKLQSGFDSWTKAVRANAKSICHKSPGLPGWDDESWILQCLHDCPLHSSCKVKCSISGICLTLHLLHSLTDSVLSRAEMFGGNVRLWQSSAYKKVASKCQIENDTNIRWWSYFVAAIWQLLLFEEEKNALFCVFCSVVVKNITAIYNIHHLV